MRLWKRNREDGSIRRSGWLQTTTNREWVIAGLALIIGYLLCLIYFKGGIPFLIETPHVEIRGQFEDVARVFLVSIFLPLIAKVQYCFWVKVSRRWTKAIFLFFILVLLTSNLLFEISPAQSFIKIVTYFISVLVFGGPPFFVTAGSLFFIVIVSVPFKMITTGMALMIAVMAFLRWPIESSLERYLHPSRGVL